MYRNHGLRLLTFTIDVGWYNIIRVSTCWFVCPTQSKVAPVAKWLRLVNLNCSSSHRSGFKPSAIIINFGNHSHGMLSSMVVFKIISKSIFHASKAFLLYESAGGPWEVTNSHTALDIFHTGMASFPNVANDVQDNVTDLSFSFYRSHKYMEKRPCAAQFHDISDLFVEKKVYHTFYPEIFFASEWLVLCDRSRLGLRNAFEQILHTYGVSSECSLIWTVRVLFFEYFLEHSSQANVFLTSWETFFCSVLLLLVDFLTFLRVLA